MKRMTFENEISANFGTFAIAYVESTSAKNAFIRSKIKFCLKIRLFLLEKRLETLHEIT